MFVMGLWKTYSNSKEKSWHSMKKSKRKNKDLVWRMTFDENKSKMLLLEDYIDWQESGRNVMSEYKILKLWDCENQRHVLTYIDNSMHNLRNWNAVLEWDRNDSDVIILFGYFIDKMDDETGKPILSKTSIETWNDFPIIDADGKFKIEVVPCNDSLIDLYNKPVHVDLPAEIIKPKRENKYAY